MAARAADEGRSGPHDGIVATDDDVAVVHQEGIGDARQALFCLVVADDQWLAMRVGTGHDKQQVARLVEPPGAHRTTGRLVPEQQVQRCRRQHHAQPGQAGRDAGQFALTLGAEDDRGSGVFQQAGLRFADPRKIAQRIGIQCHHGEGFFLALLAPAQFGDRFGIACFAGEMEATQALDRDDLPVAQQAQGFRNRVTNQRLCGRIEQVQLRAAIPAASGFGMKTPVDRQQHIRLGTARRAGRRRGWSARGRRGCAG